MLVMGKSTSELSRIIADTIQIISPPLLFPLQANVNLCWSSNSSLLLSSAILTGKTFKMFYRSASLIITSSVMSCLAISAVALRFWAKKMRKIRIGADDWLLIIGLVRLFLIRLGLRRLLTPLQDFGDRFMYFQHYWSSAFSIWESRALYRVWSSTGLARRLAVTWLWQSKSRSPEDAHQV